VYRLHYTSSIPTVARAPRTSSTCSLLCKCTPLDGTPRFDPSPTVPSLGSEAASGYNTWQLMGVAFQRQRSTGSVTQWQHRQNLAHLVKQGASRDGETVLWDEEEPLKRRAGVCIFAILPPRRASSSMQETHFTTVAFRRCLCGCWRKRQACTVTITNLTSLSYLYTKENVM
jgi:hypothetical protein